MPTPVHITFDSNVWRPLVSPQVFPNDPDALHFQGIRHAIQKNLAFGFLSETTFTLEAIQKTDRKTFFGSYGMNVKTSTEAIKDGIIHVKFVLGPSQSHHASNNPYLTKHLQDALALDFKLLRCPRIAGIGNPDLQSSYYAVDSRVSASERQERCGNISRNIEAKGWGIKHIKDIGNKHANGKNWWLDGIKNAPASEDNAIIKAVAEWADGDAVAAHYAYDNNYFCTRDTAKAAGVNSVLSPTNRNWLSQNFNVSFVTPEDIAKILTT
jgi:hypothetical protein